MRMDLPGGASLPRVVGIFGAVMMGLGSIIGTGVFVTVGIAAGLAGPSVILAIAIAAVLAAANGLSSAQLAASHAVSGGTYEYGYRFLNPSLGFTAGWMFLCAKSASAATATLGFSGYVLAAMGQSPMLARPLALGLLIILTFIVLAGVKRSNAANIVIVSITLATLAFFVAICLPRALNEGGGHLLPFFRISESGAIEWPRFLEAIALMFVAFTGYGRIATLGEEIHRPRRNIPIAIIITLLVTMAIYMSVAIIGIAAAGVDLFAVAGGRRAAPLEVVAHHVAGRWAGVVLTLGAITAMIGVLLNLILGLSRVALAMGRRGDLPARLGRLDESGKTPSAAVLFVAAIIGAIVLIGDVKLAWSFSAFTVLIYYAITNLAALRLRGVDRLFPRWIAIVGLIGCLFIAFWVEPRIWMAGLLLIAAGLIWHAARRR